MRVTDLDVDPGSEGASSASTPLEEIRPDPDIMRAEGIWENFTVADGLPDMKVECIVEDSSGFLWIGTHDGGVARFDGRGFTCFNRSHGLTGNGVYSIIEDREGSLWFATNHGLTRYDGSRFEAVDLEEPVGFLWGSCMDEEGNLWFGLERRPGKPAAVCRWDGKPRIIELAENAHAYGESIHAVCADRSARGRMWFGGDGLYWTRPDANGEEFSRQVVAEGRIFDVRGLVATEKSVYVADSCAVWKVTKSGAQTLAETRRPGFYGLAPGRREEELWACSAVGDVLHVEKESHEKMCSFSRPVQSAYQDTCGRLWVGTYGSGVYLSDLSVWRVFRPSSDSNKSVGCMMRTKSNKLYFGTQAGLWLLDGDVARRVPMYTQESSGVSSLAQMGNGVLLGTRSGTLKHISDHELESITIHRETEGYRITNLCKDERTGDVWYSCSPGRGLGRVRDGKAEHFGPENSYDIPTWIGAIHFARNQLGLIVGTDSGDGRDVLIQVSSEMSLKRLAYFESAITAIASTDDRLYVGTVSGLYEYRCGHATESEITGRLPCQIITTLIVDEQGVLWIGTEGGGIARFDGTDVGLTMVPQGDDFNSLRQVEVLSGGYACLATDGGLIRYRPPLQCPIVELSVLVDGAPLDGQQPLLSTHALTLLFRSSQRRPLRGQTYRFRVIGHSAEWQSTSQDCVNLGVLPPGDYAVEAVCVDCDFNKSDLLRRSIRVESDERDQFLQEALRSVDKCEFVGESTAARRALGRLAELARTDLSVLLLGETGTGKNIAARLLHEVSDRASGPFVQVNCGALSESLAESELFGHARGSFTGAVERRIGRFQLADGGTLFLDEVGDLPLVLQARLLNVLQERVIYPVGDDRERKVDIRVVAATNRSLKAAVAKGMFREDLLYRLDGYSLVLPPLRVRQGDVPLLARRFADGFSRRLGRKCPTFSDSAMLALENYQWPGNVRELEQVVHRAVVLAISGTISQAELPFGRDAIGEGEDRPSSTRFMTLAVYERDYLERVLAHTKGVIQGKAGAAAILGLHPSTLRSRLKKHALI